jgi:hypothetical protein
MILILIFTFVILIVSTFVSTLAHIWAGRGHKVEVLIYWVALVSALSTFITNGLCTGKWHETYKRLQLTCIYPYAGLITYRINKLQKSLQSPHHPQNESRRQTNAVVIIVESAAVYLALMVCFLVLYIAKSNAYNVILDIVGFFFTSLCWLHELITSPLLLQPYLLLSDNSARPLSALRSPPSSFEFHMGLIPIRSPRVTGFTIPYGSL